jgi:hypothetical protein
MDCCYTLQAVLCDHSTALLCAQCILPLLHQWLLRDQAQSESDWRVLHSAVCASPFLLDAVGTTTTSAVFAM